jgi:NADPH:quinone reductase-like Zn-dependent oxidoreductase
MRSIEAETFSGYGGLRQIELPKPQSAKDRVLVRVTAAGVTPLDHTILSVDTLEPMRRWCSATRARVSLRMPATPASRREAA